MNVEDGTGKGYKLKVDDENMAHVLSVSDTEAWHVNHDHQECYTMDIDGIQTDGANYWVAIIKNTNDDDMIIDSITGWVSSFSNTQIYEAYLGGTFTYASNGTVVVPTNCNAGSGKTATGEFYVNDTSGNITTVVTGSVVGRFVFGTTPILWTNPGDWILKKNGCFMLWSNLAEKLTGYITFYYHNPQRMGQQG